MAAALARIFRTKPKMTEQRRMDIANKTQAVGLVKRKQVSKPPASGLAQIGRAAARRFWRH